MGWNGAGAVVRTDGTRAGSQAWQEAKAADEDVDALPHDIHDEDLALAIAQCLNLNGENAMAADLAMAGFRVRDLGAGTSASHAARIGQIQRSEFTWGVTSGGTANAQTISLTPGITSYITGLTVNFIAGFGNTASAPTLNINAVGAKTMLDAFGQELRAGAIRAGALVTATYNGTAFITNSTFGAPIWCDTSGGSANAQTLSPAPPLAAYTNGLKLSFIAGATTTGAATLNVSSLGTVSMVDRDGFAVAAGSLVSGQLYTATYFGGSFFVDGERRQLRAVISASGATVLVSGIPSNAKRIVLTLKGISGTGTNDLELRLGDAGGMETSGYDLGGVAIVTGTNTTVISANPGDAALVSVTSGAGSVAHGRVTLTLHDVSTNDWLIDWQIARGNLGIMHMGVTTKALSATMTQLQLQWSGSDTFDAGSVGALIET
jgi:hypothetical protein